MCLLFHVYLCFRGGGGPIDVCGCSFRFLPTLAVIATIIYLSRAQGGSAGGGIGRVFKMMNTTASKVTRDGRGGQRSFSKLQQPFNRPIHHSSTLACRTVPVPFIPPCIRTELNRFYPCFDQSDGELSCAFLYHLPFLGPLHRTISVPYMLYIYRDILW